MAEKNFAVKLPPMLSGDELEKALEVLPPYSESIRDKDAATSASGKICLHGLHLG